MCAIIGLYKNNTSSVTPELLTALAAPLSHRAPDGNGIYCADPIGFYHGRLAIHDLSEKGQQPFTTPSGIVAIANGEIYNHRGLKQYLSTQTLDCHWQSTSDCEVIPYLYQLYGIEFTRYLRGMYAIALWDPRKEQLILARGPFGMKPLYYCEIDSGFYFASELRALLPLLRDSEPLSCDQQTQLELLQYHFALSEQTIVSKIKRVQPGALLVVENAKITQQTHYPSTLGFPPEKVRPYANTQSVLATFEQTLTDSVKQHLSADVPVGLFLSGGIDSTTLLLLAKQHHQKPLHTYSLGFESDTTHNEQALAETLAKHCNTQHHTVTLTEAEFWRLLPQAILATDDPTADYAIVPTLKLAMMAKSDVTVVLSGEGGDEIFAGYGRYRHAMRPFWRLRKAPYRSGDLSSLKLLQGNARHSRHAIQEIEKACRYQGYSPLYTTQTIDLRTWLPNDLLIKLDRTLMWQGLEGRCPFLDKKVIQFANALPEHYKVRGKLGKWIMREWLTTQLPDYPAMAHKKGFTVPLQAWLEGQRDTLARCLMTHPVLRSFCQPQSLTRLFQKPFNKARAKTTWSLLYYTLWYQLHIQQVSVDQPYDAILTERAE